MAICVPRDLPTCIQNDIIMHTYALEMQRYTIWVYRYIAPATFVSQYSYILYDTVIKLISRTFFQNYSTK